jgi:CubicO group peptidase (beta-lactamase class C family)
MVLALAFASRGLAAQQMPAELRAKVDAAIRQVVEKSGVPSASVGIVQNGRIVYTGLYLQPGDQTGKKLTAAASYPVGSISKQFTAACILLLEQDGKLTLDDTVSRWFPELTSAKEITLRELLSHTSGYEDYAPQDYTIPAWMKPVDPAKVVAEWAGKPLDFEPGTQWQYSNTNFMLAALIVERASGMTYFDFLRKRVLQPAGLTHALNLDTERDQLQVRGYERHALAPLRPAILEAPGWYFGDASLAMPVADLLAWDISIMNRTVLSPKSYDEFETPVKLKDGKPTTYGLGVQVLTQGGHKVLEHSGEVGGYTAENIVLPEEKLAIAVLTNQEASDAAGDIAAAIAPLLLEKHGMNVTVKLPKPEETQLKTIMAGLQDGKIDRGQFTADASFYFSPETLGDFASSLKPLGAVTTVEETEDELRGGMTGRMFNVGFAGGKSVKVSTYTMPDGKLEQLLVEGEN